MRSWQATGAIVAALIVVLVLIVAVVVGRARRSESERGLSGFWVGEQTFLDQAGLGSMFLYLAPPEDGKSGGTSVRRGYLVMTTTDAQVLTSQKVELQYSSGAALAVKSAAGLFRGAAGTGAGAPFEFSAEIAYEDDAVLPERLRLSYSAAEGTLALSGDGKVFGFLTKDAAVSLSANEAYADSAGNP